MLDMVRRLEAARFSAMKAGDLDALAALLDDELTYVHSNGRVDDKANYLDSLRRGVIGYESIEVTDDHHRVFEDCVVLVRSVVARMRLAPGAAPVTRRLVLMSVWRLNPDGHWTLAAMQSTADVQQTP